MGFAYQVKQLLHLLSKNGKLYWERHKSMLRGFVLFTEQKPFFGLQELQFPIHNCRYFVWPNRITPDMYDASHKIILKSFELRHDRFLTGLKINYESGAESEVIQGGFSTPNDIWNTYELGCDGDTKRIAKFGVRFDAKSDGRMHYTGMRSYNK